MIPVSNERCRNTALAETDALGGCEKSISPYGETGNSVIKPCGFDRWRTF